MLHKIWAAIKANQERKAMERIASTIREIEFKHETTDYVKTLFTTPE